MNYHPLRGVEARRDNWRAMQLSLAAGVLMLAGKVTAHALTGSAAILSDALESVIHVLAVAFRGLQPLLEREARGPAVPVRLRTHRLLLAGFEGALIILAAIAIIWTATYKWLHGLELERLGTGTLLVAAAGASTARWAGTLSGRAAGPGRSSWRPTAGTSSPTPGPVRASSAACAWCSSPAGCPSIRSWLSPSRSTSSGRAAGSCTDRWAV